MAAVLTPDAVEHGTVPARDLIRLSLRLKWTLWKRSYRKNVGKIVGVSIGVLYALGGLGLLVFLFLSTTVLSGEGSLFPMIARGLGVLTVLLWFLIPVFAFGLDDTLDPRAFAVYPRSAKELQPGMLAAAVLSIPSLFTLAALLIATVFEALWLVLYGPGAVGIAAGLIALLPANLAGFVLCLLLPRAWFAHSAARSSSRSGREIGGVIGMMVMFAAIYGFSLGAQRIGDIDGAMLMRWLPRVIEGFAWTPFGALFAVPMDLAEGRWLTGLLRAVIGAAAIVLTWLWWRRSIDVSLTSALTGDASSGSTRVTSLVPPFVPAGPFGAAMGRALRYWRRDTRYLAAIGIYPLIVVFLAAMGLMLPESRPMMMGMAVFMAGLSGISLSNELGFDGPAGWVQIVAGMPARANLLGRVAAMAVIMVPPLMVVMIVLPLLYGLPSLIPLVMMASFGTMLGAWGLSMLISVLMPYPSSAPGTNPMKDKSASSANAMLSMGIAMVAIFIPQLPTIGVGIWGVVVGSLPLQLLAGVLSLILGGLAFWIGMRLATARLDARYPDLFQKVRDHI
ncbi:hypothetical protein V1260_14460 [Brachybacterium sp. J144]|uniref:hypothetical protein n=1 Tax=Brachybacterium sp. J144 TaxID=3116487 RepID=UPI002E77F112|nr:hypothetical protein [Brachybacterium sp. J144]MEE1651981.1 hypothetical protein [Brachybacterium sp. J144]